MNAPATSLLPAVPARGALVSAETVQQIERHVVQNVEFLDDIATAENWLSDAAAFEAYLRDKELQRPILGARRRIEARIGQLLGEAVVGAHHSVMTEGAKLDKDDRSDFRILAHAFADPRAGLSVDEWRKSRRALGERWERQFCRIASQFGRSFTAHQIGRNRSAQAFYHFNGKYHPMTLPDITIWTAPGEHHEVKHKDATTAGYFGLEKYRLEALSWFLRETGQRVFYTIHDYNEQRGSTREERKKNLDNDPLHWVTCDVRQLEDPVTIAHIRLGKSWVNGKQREVPICYWHTSQFMPLFWLWKGIPQRDLFGRREEAA